MSVRWIDRSWLQSNPGDGYRREDEFFGKSNCSDCTPELDSVVIEAFRTISILVLEVKGSDDLTSFPRVAFIAWVRRVRGPSELAIGIARIVGQSLTVSPRL
jgi:hypothetical protein